MKIYRTTAYCGEIPLSERVCTSRRQWAQLKNDFGYFGITRMKLQRFEIPDHLWVLDQELPEVKHVEQVSNDSYSIDEILERLDLPPWAFREPEEEPVVISSQGPIPFSEIPEIIKQMREKGEE